MKFGHLIFIVFAALLSSACASRTAKTDTAPATESAKKTAAPAAPEGEIVGKPASGSKFAKLKLGMTLKQVEKLIGAPTEQWQRPTAKMAIPFYFGPDRWVMEYSYEKEGLLTFNYGEEQFLTRVVVNNDEGKESAK